MCSSLQSICIPSSFETIAECCFWICAGLSIVTFESGCRPAHLDGSAFEGTAVPSSCYVVGHGVAHAALFSQPDDLDIDGWAAVKSG
jgi:hypothetical protein